MLIICKAVCTEQIRVRKATKKAKTKRKKLLNKSFDELVSESYEVGMTYGKYKEALKSGKTFEELQAAYLDRKRRLELWE